MPAGLWPRADGVSVGCRSVAAPARRSRRRHACGERQAASAPLQTINHPILVTDQFSPAPCLVGHAPVHSASSRRGDPPFLGATCGLLGHLVPNGVVGNDQVTDFRWRRAGECASSPTPSPSPIGRRRASFVERAGRSNDDCRHLGLVAPAQWRSSPRRTPSPRTVCIAAHRPVIINRLVIPRAKLGDYPLCLAQA